MHLSLPPFLLTVAFAIPACVSGILGSASDHIGTLDVALFLAGLWMVGSLTLVAGWALAGRMLSRPGG